MRPEPEWWAEARALRGKMRWCDIARKFGKSRSAVVYCFAPKLQPAPRGAMGRYAGAGERSGLPYTPEELEKAIDLHDRLGLTWGQVASRLGRSEDSVTVQVWRFRRGRSFKILERIKESEEIAEKVFNGMSMNAVARERGCHPSNIWQRLMRIGVDQEVIQEVRAERKLAA